jgi:hypothetical protein
MAEQTLAPESTRPLTQTERVVDTFIAPSLTFNDIRRSTSWWLPFLLAVIASLAVAYTIDRKVGFEQVVETQIHLSPSQESQMASLPPDARALQLHRMAIGYKYATYASPIFILVFAALASLILWASFNFGLGARTTFGQMFCLNMYANLPRLLASIVTIIMLSFGGSPETFNLKDPVGTNIGYYMPDAAPWLRALLGFFDVIGIWVLILLILGGSIVAKVKIGSAAAVVVGWWLLILIASVAAAAAFS